MLTKLSWWAHHTLAHLQNAIGFTSNYESKPLKSKCFVSDACTCKIFEVSNSFSTCSSGQKNNEKLIHKTIRKVTYKMFIGLTAWPCTKWIQNFKKCICTCITHKVLRFQRFGLVVRSQSGSLLEMCSPTPLDNHITLFCLHF